ncbi:redox-regulated ATPase YchF [Maritalea porphyrae]|uniref:redox-regulated ATPase YchF n=1 Tax=Maritalea porphyrae TaxID=880732 RepID=UPI0022AEDEB7|nr:redox-regulated ATPase YchF [Maritalea porphyrae]MCZ4273598.1 redox-regulated ATPase YchF [Maritalea porphyrae]
MGFKCGIVGLPNVGKSTLFNALTRTAAAQAANFPFCTIEPNVGEVSVPDERLDKIAKIGGSAEIIPTRLSFVDIAGLVKGAAQGEGLGNQFLANIREVDAIAYVLRCFVNSDIIHVSNNIDPIADAEVVETELMLSDMESLEKRIGPLEKRLRGQDKDAKLTLELVNRALEVLREGQPARHVELAEDEKKAFKELNLLTSKPALYICNVDEDSAADGNEMTKKVEEYAKAQNARMVIISAEIESELSQLEDEEQNEYLESLGLEEPGLNRIIREGYKLLNLQTYFTVGPKEARAWTVKVGTKAPQAAGVIHSDFERGFIRAQTIAYDDFVALGGEAAAKEAGKARDEGKEYVVKDGDIMLFKFNT